MSTVIDVIMKCKLKEFYRESFTTSIIHTGHILALTVFSVMFGLHTIKI